MDDGRPRRHQHLCDPRGGRAEGHRTPGSSAAPQGRQPLDARGPDRLLGSRAGPGRPRTALSGRGPLPPAGRGAGAARPARVGVGPGTGAASIGATTVVGRTTVGVADHLATTRAAAVEAGTVQRSSSVSAWLPIIYGCDKTCTYCIVPFSRGPERSRPFDEIVAEARSIAASGFQEVTLLGQNVNSYGHDLDRTHGSVTSGTERWAGRRLDLGSKPDLAELIRAIDGVRTADGVPAIPRLRFVTSHPWDLSDRLIEAMAECPSVCESLHLPVQSGDDDVLRRMGRQYTMEHYLERLDRIRAAVPDITVTHRHHRRVLRGDRGAVREDPRVPAARPVRPDLRGCLLASDPVRRRPTWPTTYRRSTSAAA